jgi:WD40 repeat protein
MIKVWYVGRGRRSIHNPVVNPYSSCCTWSNDSRYMFCTTFITLDDLLTAHKKQREWDEARKREWKRRPGLGPPPLVSPFPVPQGQPAVARMVDHPRQRIQCLDVSTGAVVRTWDTSSKPDILAASPDGKWLASATKEGLVQLCPANGGGQAVPLEAPPGAAAASRRKGLPLKGPTGGQLLLSWSADGKRLACSTPQHTTIRLWDPDTRKLVQTLPGHGKPLRSLSWSPDGQRLASAAEDGKVKLWDVRSGRPTATFPYFIKQERPQFNLMGGNTFASASVLSWSPDGKRLAVAGEDEEIKVWDVGAGKELVTLRGDPANEARGRHNVVCAVAWNPRFKRLATAVPDGTFVLWDTSTWQKVLALRPPAVRSVAPAAFASHAGELVWSRDGWQLAFYSVSGTVTIWDATPRDGKLGQ